MKSEGHLIKQVLEGSIASELEIEPGDVLLRVNNTEIKDVLDYHYAVNDEYLELLIRKPDGEEWELEIDKDLEEDLGIVFEEGLMDSYLSCRNKCIFCFIDQMPPNMRETLYFKDDDARLSFLQGNYITLTNMSDEDLQRIIFYKLSPINVSVHTTNKELRCRMLKNRFAGDALDKIDLLYEAGITMNGQIVLCKGVNDGQELDNSIRDLAKYIPHMQSVSIVPVGISKYREGLHELDIFTKEDAIDVLNIIHKWQNILYKEHGTRFIHASDEWYLKAEIDMPTEEEYEGYQQIENGVGMVRSLEEEFEDYLKTCKGSNAHKKLSVATGVLAYPFIKSLMDKMIEKYPNYNIHVYPIQNNFFGKDITVAGLLTGQDIINQLKEQELGEYLLLPSSLLRYGEDVLLDDLTIKDLETALQINIRIVQSDGTSFVNAVID